MAEIQVLLLGGPSYFPEEQRRQITRSLTEVIKHRFHAGYEHFRHQGSFAQVDGEEVALFEWVARTAIAE